MSLPFEVLHGVIRPGGSPVIVVRESSGQQRWGLTVDQARSMAAALFIASSEAACCADWFKWMARQSSPEQAEAMLDQFNQERLKSIIAPP